MSDSREAVRAGVMAVREAVEAGDLELPDGYDSIMSYALPGHGGGFIVYLRPCNMEPRDQGSVGIMGDLYGTSPREDH